MNRERWLEMDLYWFQGGPLTQKVPELFDRLTPLWGQAHGTRKGLAICVGWLFDMVLEWNGDPDAVIPCCQAPKYEPWTYRRLQELIVHLNEEAARRGLDDFHVALILMGVESQSFPESACEGWSGRTEEASHQANYDIEGKWFFAHPEVYDDRFDLFFFGAPVRVPAGEEICVESPATFGEYFAHKLASVATFVGFGAIVFRDHIFTKAYIRGYSKGRYMAPAAQEAWNSAIIDTLQTIRLMAPELILIGYSSGTSAVEEWRSHGFDLERVAKAGCLDLWVTQTWASAWGDYWPAHSMGFTFQLMNALVHQTMLAGTKCKHLFLVETFDAWEPWDSVHQYPSKVQWEIWGYSHEGVLLPDGEVSHSTGCYISWMHRRSELLPAETVDLLSGCLNEAAADLVLDPKPGGPCIVYPRNAFEESLANPASESRGEEVDDWAAMLVKYGSPILSITRTEWLLDVTADGYLLPLPWGLNDRQCDRILHEASSGKPVLLVGDPAWIDPKLRDKLGVEIETKSLNSRLPSSAKVLEPLATEVGTEGGAVNQRRRNLAPSSTMLTRMESLGGPILSQWVGGSCWVWETPEWGTPFELHMSFKSIQSPQIWAAVSIETSRQGWDPSGLGWANDDLSKPVCFLFWRYPDGTGTVMLANLETGITGNSQFCVGGVLSANAVPKPSQFGVPGRWGGQEERSVVRLGAHKACLLSFSVREATLAAIGETACAKT